MPYFETGRTGSMFSYEFNTSYSPNKTITYYDAGHGIVCRVTRGIGGRGYLNCNLLNSLYSSVINTNYLSIHTSYEHYLYYNGLSDHDKKRLDEDTRALYGSGGGGTIYESCTISFPNKYIAEITDGYGSYWTALKDWQDLVINYISWSEYNSNATIGIPIHVAFGSGVTKYILTMSGPKLKDIGGSSVNPFVDVTSILTPKVDIGVDCGQGVSFCFYVNGIYREPYVHKVNSDGDGPTFYGPGLPIGDPPPNLDYIPIGDFAETHLYRFIIGGETITIDIDDYLGNYGSSATANFSSSNVSWNTAGKTYEMAGMDSNARVIDGVISCEAYAQDIPRQYISWDKINGTQTGTGWYQYSRFVRTNIEHNGIGINLKWPVTPPPSYQYIGDLKNIDGSTPEATPHYIDIFDSKHWRGNISPVFTPEPYFQIHVDKRPNYQGRTLSVTPGFLVYREDDDTYRYDGVFPNDVDQVDYSWEHKPGWCVLKNGVYEPLGKHTYGLKLLNPEQFDNMPSNKDVLLSYPKSFHMYDLEVDTSDITIEDFSTGWSGVDCVVDYTSSGLYVHDVGPHGSIHRTFDPTYMPPHRWWQLDVDATDGASCVLSTTDVGLKYKWPPLVDNKEKMKWVNSTEYHPYYTYYSSINGDVYNFPVDGGGTIYEAHAPVLCTGDTPKAWYLEFSGSGINIDTYMPSNPPDDIDYITSLIEQIRPLNRYVEDAPVSNNLHDQNWPGDYLRWSWGIGHISGIFFDGLIPGMEYTFKSMVAKSTGDISKYVNGTGSTVSNNNVVIAGCSNIDSSGVYHYNDNYNNAPVDVSGVAYPISTEFDDFDINKYIIGSRDVVPMPTISVCVDGRNWWDFHTYIPDTSGVYAITYLDRNDYGDGINYDPVSYYIPYSGIVTFDDYDIRSIENITTLPISSFDINPSNGSYPEEALGSYYDSYPISYDNANYIAPVEMCMGPHDASIDTSMSVYVRPKYSSATAHALYGDGISTGGVLKFYFTRVAQGKIYGHAYDNGVNMDDGSVLTPSFSSGLFVESISGISVDNWSNFFIPVYPDDAFDDFLYDPNMGLYNPDTSESLTYYSGVHYSSSVGNTETFNSGQYEFDRIPAAYGISCNGRIVQPLAHFDRHNTRMVINFRPRLSGMSIDHVRINGRNELYYINQDDGLSVCIIDDHDKIEEDTTIADTSRYISPNIMIDRSNGKCLIYVDYDTREVIYSYNTSHNITTWRNTNKKVLCEGYDSVSAVYIPDRAKIGLMLYSKSTYQLYWGTISISDHNMANGIDNLTLVSGDIPKHKPSLWYNSKENVIIAVYAKVVNKAPHDLYKIISTDCGVTWSTPVLIGTTDLAPDIAVDTNSGSIHIADVIRSDNTVWYVDMPRSEYGVNINSKVHTPTMMHSPSIQILPSNTISVAYYDDKGIPHVSISTNGSSWST